ncbi:MAG: hypothetical protein AAFY21_10780 [Cyanobacteria bacterium J06641_2]
MDAPIRPSGSAFNNNKFNGNRIKGTITGRTVTNYITLTKWCKGNFISKKIGRTLLAKNLLIGIRHKGQWNVCANPDCLEELLDYIGLEELFIDAQN